MNMLIRKLLNSGRGRKIGCFVYGITKGLPVADATKQMAKQIQEYLDGPRSWAKFSDTLTTLSASPYYMSNQAMESHLRDWLLLYTNPTVNLLDVTCVVSTIALGTSLNDGKQWVLQYGVLKDLFDIEVPKDQITEILHNWAHRTSAVDVANLKLTKHRHKPVHRDILLANGSAAVNLATQAFVSEDWQMLSVLADALEEVGYQDERTIAHLRDGRQHYRGCWALDLIMYRCHD